MLRSPDFIQRRYEKLSDRLANIKLSDCKARTRQRQVRNIETEFQDLQAELYELYNWVERCCTAFNELSDLVDSELDLCEYEIMESKEVYGS